ncbi:hypothetical protein A3K64_03930 [Candidatus Micrarchaeota archaeon RBG_16_36_9]|nr:MAG: hypothetical protein A3K64_03930 [Candidatus Micrarchaeota archaeon RBG_16_36_9]
MTFKQFLKPDWRKIVIFVIFLIVSLFFAFYTDISDNISDIFSPLLFVLIFPWYLFLGLISFISLSSVYLFFISFIPVIIYQYLLSCLIVWIYDKLRKRK